MITLEELAVISGQLDIADFMKRVSQAELEILIEELTEKRNLLAPKVAQFETLGNQIQKIENYLLLYRVHDIGKVVLQVQSAYLVALQANPLLKEDYEHIQLKLFLDDLLFWTVEEKDTPWPSMKDSIELSFKKLREYAEPLGYYPVGSGSGQYS
jgi:hypothetical protein